MLFDTHLHVIDRNRLHYPWLPDVPDLDRDSLYEHYARDALRCGITNVLHMEVDVSGDAIEQETAFIKEIAARPESLVRGAIAACRPEEEGFPAYLERCLADPFVKGFRRVLHVAPEAYIGGPFALVRTGDLITVDIDQRRIHLEVSDEELAARRAAWTPPPPRYARGYGYIFSQHVRQANDGCDFDFLQTDFGAPVGEPSIY